MEEHELFTEKEIEKMLIEIGYVQSVDEFGNETWDEGKLHWARIGFIEGLKLATKKLINK